jgi:hypothetical protein
MHQSHLHSKRSFSFFLCSPSNVRLESCVAAFCRAEAPQGPVAPSFKEPLASFAHARRVQRVHHANMQHQCVFLFRFNLHEGVGVKDVYAGAQRAFSTDRANKGRFSSTFKSGAAIYKVAYFVIPSSHEAASALTWARIATAVSAARRAGLLSRARTSSSPNQTDAARHCAQPLGVSSR